MKDFLPKPGDKVHFVVETVASVIQTGSDWFVEFESGLSGYFAEGGLGLVLPNILHIESAPKKTLKQLIDSHEIKAGMKFQYGDEVFTVARSLDGWVLVSSYWNTLDVEQVNQDKLELVG